MVTENKEHHDKDVDIVLAMPFSFEWESNDDGYKTPNILQRICSLFKNVRPGSDLSRYQIPVMFNVPKSQLQCLGEKVYAANEDLLRRCAEGENALERMTRVVGWSISTIRPLPFGAAPFNPILGETHHVSRGALNVILEQVSHHPSVFACHATDENSNVELQWCDSYLPKFHGATIEVYIDSKRRLSLLDKGETYVMNYPNLVIKLLPVTGTEWVGTVKIKCQESGLEAELCYKSSSILHKGSKRSIKGKIFHSLSSKALYEVHGHWDRIVLIKDLSNEKVEVLYDAHKAISRLHSASVMDIEGVSRSESARVWTKVNRGIMSKDWDSAQEAKRAIEEKQRELRRERNSKGEEWKAKHFNVSYSKGNGWDCSPKEKTVPRAPIVYSV
ncbi:hypothetical protein Drorol1_Dr00005701 [Drosera rotundifolia]